MGYRVQGSVSGAGHLPRYVTIHPGQLCLAIPSWVGALSTNQKTVMPCSCGINSGVESVWVAGKTDSIVTHEPYLSALEIKDL